MDKKILGYDYVDGKLVENEKEARFVKKMFQKCNQELQTRKKQSGKKTKNKVYYQIAGTICFRYYFIGYHLMSY